MLNLIRKHPVASYFLLAITISWTGILFIVLPGAIPASPADAERLFGPVYLAMLLGPSVAGLAVTAITGGRSGLRDFRERLFRWRVGANWYAIALLAAPITLGVTLLVLTLVSPSYAPSLFAGNTDPSGPVRTGTALSFVLVGLAVGIGAGFSEELGWTGVAVPRMLQRRGILATGVGVGLVWGAWHYLAIHWGSADAMTGLHPVVYLVVALFAFLPPYRVLMVWMYTHTQSLLLGVLMHMALTSSMIVLGPAVQGRELIVFDLVFGLMLWIVAGVVLAVEAHRRSGVGQPDIRHRYYVLRTPYGKR